MPEKNALDNDLILPFPRYCRQKQNLVFPNKWRHCCPHSRSDYTMAITMLLATTRWSRLLTVVEVQSGYDYFLWGNSANWPSCSFHSNTTTVLGVLYIVRFWLYDTSHYVLLPVVEWKFAANTDNKVTTSIYLLLQPFGGSVSIIIGGAVSVIGPSSAYHLFPSNYADYRWIGFARRRYTEDSSFNWQPRWISRARSSASTGFLCSARGSFILGQKVRCTCWKFDDNCTLVTRK